MWKSLSEDMNIFIYAFHGVSVVITYFLSFGMPILVHEKKNENKTKPNKENHIKNK